jgi:hypothetical protein
LAFGTHHRISGGFSFASGKLESKLLLLAKRLERRHEISIE